MKRPDHQAVLDLLRAFGIETKGVTAATIRSTVFDMTTVEVEYVIFDADVTHEHKTYAVTPAEVA
jgi:hypothetical protein